METDIHINRLPLEILGKVMSFLDWPHRENVMLVCKRWYELLRQPVFQQEMFIKLSSVNHHEEIPSSLGQRKIRNLKICREKDSPLNFCKLAGLLPHIKFVRLGVVFSVADIELCFQYFPRLEAIEIEIVNIHEITKVLGQDQVYRSRLSAMMVKLREATVVIPCWYRGEDLILLLNSFSGVREVSLQWKMPHNRVSHKTCYGLVDLLGKSDLVNCLQHLDLSSLHMSPESFSLLVGMPDLNLCSLKFVSSHGARHLEVLAKSSQNLQSLDVTFEGLESYDVKYSAISALLAAKPSLKSITVSGIMYDREEPLGNIVEEWPDTSTLHILTCLEENLSLLPVDICDEMIGEFSRKADRNNLILKSASVSFDEGTLLKLAQHCPHLEELKIQAYIDCHDTVSLPLLLESLPGITKLSVSLSGLGNVDLRMHAVPNGVTSRLLNLQSLYLEYCELMTDAVIATIRFPGLRHLWLSNSLGITDSGVCSVVANNPGLRLLGLGGCTNVTDKSVEAIGTHLRYLQCLLLYRCAKVTPDAAQMLEDGCHMLEFIDVHGCREDVIRAVKKMKGSMRYLSDILYSSECSEALSTTSKWSFAIQDDWIDLDSLLEFTDRNFDALY